jgi:hypothetical protein
MRLKGRQMMLRNKGYSKNVELLGYHDLKDRPGFQMAMQVVDGRYYLYLSHFRHSGWTVMEVTDPENPRYVKFIEGPGYRDKLQIRFRLPMD